MNTYFQNNTSSSPLNVIPGKDEYGYPSYWDITKMPNLLLTGPTASGKTTCINNILRNILKNASPEEVKLILIDTKGVEFDEYNGIPHLLEPVITDEDKAVPALERATKEIEKRYELFAKDSVRNITEYNEMIKQPLPRILIVIDELHDLMTSSPRETEDAVTKLAHSAEATGIHMIIASQSTSPAIITSAIYDDNHFQIAVLGNQFRTTER